MNIKYKMTLLSPIAASLLIVGCAKKQCVVQDVSKNTIVTTDMDGMSKIFFVDSTCYFNKYMDNLNVGDTLVFSPCGTPVYDRQDTINVQNNKAYKLDMTAAKKQEMNRATRQRMWNQALGKMHFEKQR